MQICTKFNVGDMVWSATKYFSDETIESESASIIPFYYKKEGPFRVKKIEIDITETLTVNYILMTQSSQYMHKLDQELPYKYKEDWLFLSEGDAMVVVDNKNKTALQVKLDLQAKCR